jgi:hypothetical protein
MRGSRHTGMLRRHWRDKCSSLGRSQVGGAAAMTPSVRKKSIVSVALVAFVARIGCSTTDDGANVDPGTGRAVAGRCRLALGRRLPLRLLACTANERFRFRAFTFLPHRMPSCSRGRKRRVTHSAGLPMASFAFWTRSRARSAAGPLLVEMADPEPAIHVPRASWESSRRQTARGRVEERSQ